MARQNWLIAGVLVVAACGQTSNNDIPPAGIDGGVGDAGAAFSCGTPEGLDDPPSFVGSCLGKADSNGDQTCLEYITRPEAPFIGRDCLMQTCTHHGGTWISSHCPSGFTFCFHYLQSDDETVDWYANYPCPPEQ